MKTKKAKVTKKYFMKRKLKFEDYKHYLKAHLENKVNHLEKKVLLTLLVFKKIMKNSSETIN